MLRIILVDEERTVGQGLNGSKLLKEWGLCCVEGAGMTKNRVLRPNYGLYFSLIPPSRVRTVEKEVSSVAESASPGGQGTPSQPVQPTGPTLSSAPPVPPPGPSRPRGFRQGALY